MRRDDTSLRTFHTLFNYTGYRRSHRDVGCFTSGLGNISNDSLNSIAYSELVESSMPKDIQQMTFDFQASQRDMELNELLHPGRTWRTPGGGARPEDTALDLLREDFMNGSPIMPTQYDFDSHFNHFQTSIHFKVRDRGRTRKVALKSADAATPRPRRAAAVTVQTGVGPPPAAALYACVLV
ncbi:hypothetical protein EVAR_35229_1 [Eumeta japonica]|uniref:Uncharacterized protein n=1 Tax=Eumeta variegata TaxID=151549 RepID=A0A4C1VG16_EUMVA|nr:hypothetical protein EVAR_35229_1 [Eumeta japonica]